MISFPFPCVGMLVCLSFMNHPLPLSLQDTEEGEEEECESRAASNFARGHFYTNDVKVIQIRVFLLLFFELPFSIDNPFGLFVFLCMSYAYIR